MRGFVAMLCVAAAAVACTARAADPALFSMIDDTQVETVSAGAPAIAANFAVAPTIWDTPDWDVSTPAVPVAVLQDAPVTRVVRTTPVTVRGHYEDRCRILADGRRTCDRVWVADPAPVTTTTTEVKAGAFSCADCPCACEDCTCGPVQTAAPVYTTTTTYSHGYATYGAGPVRGVFRAILGVNRRQARRAARHASFGSGFGACSSCQ